MAVTIYDSLSGSKREFVPIEENSVKMYVCGITPYALSHLGHARCYVAWDVVYRYFQYRGFDVTYVRNFTDVDDKIINEAAKRDVDPLELAEENIQAFYEDMDALCIARPDHEPRVSTSIDDIIALVQSLEDRGLAYSVDGDVFFEVAKFENYGCLSKRPLDDMMAGARVDVDTRKRNPMDFALWKSTKDGEINWPSPWGPGRPGWHIECSAMSMAHLGPTFDIHCGGRDLIFPHHENEIAQSEAASGCRYVNYWMHNGFINIDQQKMSKSIGNVFNVRDILQRYEPLVLRYFLMCATHYRNPMNFCDTLLDEASARMAYFYESLRKAKDFVEVNADAMGSLTKDQDFIDGISGRFRDAMDDDFSVVKAMELISELFRYLNEYVSVKKKAALPAAVASAQCLLDELRSMDSVLNLFGEEPRAYLLRHRTKAAMRLGISIELIERQISKRIAARTARDWAMADQIRDELESLGVILMDRPGGTDWSIDESIDAETTEAE
ncbi:MAG: cysteine--tRNA ligase [Myxococcota bacterium]|nr:cysteine--tRNA ligase [Myxococcota bacterium]